MSDKKIRENIPIKSILSLSLILPVTFLITGFYVLRLFGPLSLRHGDPDFIYLLSGLSMGNLHLNVGHVDNPGTPLQIIVAVVTRIVHLFAGQGSYSEDVLKRPDFYLNQVLKFNYLLNAGFIFYAGYNTGKYMKLYYIPIIQLTLLTTWTIFYNTTVILPEVIIAVPVSLLIVQLIKKYSKNEYFDSYRDILIIAAIGAFGLSIKLDYLPLLLIPVFLIRNWKGHLTYWPSVFVFFLIFAFPVINRRFYFIEWVKGLIVHSGKYGLGDSNFIDLQEFIINLKNLFAFYKYFYFTCIVLFLVYLLSLTGIVIFEKNKIRNRIVLGLLLTAILQTFIVSKHFGYGYMMPLLYLFPFIILLILETFTFNKRIISMVSILTTFVVLFLFFKSLSSILKWKVPELTIKQEINFEIKKQVNDSTLLILDQPYNFYFHESPLLFGWFFQGNYRKLIKEKLDIYYPNTYVYDYGAKKFFHWGDLYSFNEILSKRDKLFVFLNNKSSYVFDPKYLNDSLSARLDTVYLNPVTSDKLLRIEKFN
jgi:hypothetical protein